MSTSVERIVPPLAALAVAFALAGCAGNTQMTPSGAGQVPSTGGAAMSFAQQQLVSNAQPDACDGRGDLHVQPCNIVFDPQQRGPANIIVHSHGLAIVERNDCSERNVANVKRVEDSVYKVTAGASNGRCEVHLRASDGRHNFVVVENRLHLGR